MVVAILFVVLILQGVLASFVYRDAHSRGDDEGLWLTVTLILGVVGVLLYLLNRPDERIPEDERQRSASTGGLRLVVLYGGSMIVGGILTVVLLIVYGQLVAIPQSQLATFNLQMTILGVLASPVLLHLYRKRGRISSIAMSS